MTKKQIEAVLKEIGNYSMETKICPEELASIILKSNSLIYLDGLTKVKFKNNGILELYRKENADDTEFNKLVAFYDYDTVVGFNLTPYFSKRPYIGGQSV